MRRTPIAAALALLLLAAFLLPALPARAETAVLVERNGEEVTVAQGYWKRLSMSNGKEYNAFFLTAPATSSLGRTHAPPEVFVDLSEFRTIQEVVQMTTTATQEAVIISPDILGVAQYAKGTDKLRVSLRNRSLYAGERVSVRLSSPVSASQELTLVANGGTGEAVFSTSIWQPGPTSASLEAVVLENLDPNVKSDYRYPSSLKTTWQGTVNFDFWEPGLSYTPTPTGVTLSVTNRNEVRGQIQVYYEMRKLNDGSLVQNGYLTSFNTSNAWWNGNETRTFSFQRPNAGYGSVRLSVAARYGNASGPAAYLDYVFEVLAPEVSFSDNGSTVRVTVRNANSYSGSVRVYITHDGLQIYNNTFTMSAGGTWTYDIAKYTSASPNPHTISVSARFAPEDGPKTIRDFSYTIYAPDISFSDGGSYIRVTVTNANNFSGSVRVQITHDGSQVALTTVNLAAGGSWYYDVTKSNVYGTHTVGVNARFAPDSGPARYSETRYEKSANAPDISFLDTGTQIRITVTNQNGFGGYIRIYVTHDGAAVSGLAPRTDWYSGYGSRDFYVNKKTSSSWHTVGVNARFDPDNNGPYNYEETSYYVESDKAPSISFYDAGSYIEVTVWNENSYGGNIGVYIRHDGVAVVNRTDWFSGYGSKTYKVTKSSASGWHTVDCNARFNPPSGPLNYDSYSYYVKQQSYDPPYVYTEYGYVKVYNPSSRTGWIRVYVSQGGYYLAGSSTSEDPIGAYETKSWYVGYGKSGSFKGWNYDYSKMNNNSWGT